MENGEWRMKNGEWNIEVEKCDLPMYPPSSILHLANTNYE
jgi:hypothetical protein